MDVPLENPVKSARLLDRNATRKNHTVPLLKQQVFFYSQNGMVL